MSTIATGVFKTVAIKRQTGLGTIAAAGGAGTSQYLRRVKSTLDLAKASYKSNEIRPSQQTADLRHGVRSVAGTLNAELSAGTYQQLFEALLRQRVQNAVTTGAIATVTAAVTSGAQGTFTRSAGSYLSDGFKIGDVVTSSGWATTGVPNNAHYSVIVALTATVMTVQFLDGVAMGPKAAGDSVTIAQVGKKTWIPQSSQTRDYFTVEHYFADVSQSEVFTDVVATDANVQLPPTGMATVDFTLMGLNMVKDTAQYFTSPAAASTGSAEAAVNGLLIVGGNVVGNVTGLNIQIKGNYSAPGGVVGSNVDPDIFPGTVEVSGQMTVLFQDATLRDNFINEDEVSVCVVLTGSNIAAPSFTAFNLSRTKFSGATKDDQQQGLTQTLPFTALENVNGGATVANLATTLSIQDSAFA